MANRHLARSVVLQVLFERDANGGALSQEDGEQRLKEYASEFGARESDMPFMQALLRMAIAKQREVDEVIKRAAPEWPIEKIAAIDRNILRLGLAELLFADRTQVPPKVAINEAIELAKNFGGSASSRFVNGVLGAVYEELGEPGKEEGGPRKQATPPAALERLAGAIVYARHEGEVYLAFVHDIFGHWTISKGKVGDKPEHKEETVEEAAIREIREEIGLSITIQKKLGENTYVANDSRANGGKKRKHVTYFLAEAPFADLQLKKTGGLDDAQWFPLAAVGDLNFYDDTLKIIIPALTLLAKK
jgi:transcription antitermination protein NusB